MKLAREGDTQTARNTDIAIEKISQGANLLKVIMPNYFKKRGFAMSWLMGKKLALVSRRIF